MKCNLFRNVKKTVNFLVIIVCSLALVLSATLIVTPELNVKSAQASVIIDSPTTSNIFTIKDITFTLSYNSWIEDKNMAALFSGSTGHPFFVAENSSDKITVSGLAAPISQSTNINSDTNVSDTILASEIRSDITYKLWSSQCSTAGGGYTNTCRVHKAKVFKEVGDLLYSWTFTKTSTIKEISIGDSTNYNDGYYQFGNDIDTLFLNKFVNSLVLDSDAMPTPNPSPSSSSSPSPSGVKLVFDSVSYDYYASRPTYNIKLKLVDGYFSSNVDSGDLSFGGIWAGSLVNNVTTVVEDNSKKAILISLSKNQAQKGQTGQIYINKDKIVDNVSQQKAIADLEIAVTDNYISSIIESYDPKAKDIVFAYDEKQAIDDANKSLNARANNNADSFIKGSVVPVAAERTGYFLHEGLNKVVSYLSDNVNKALNNIEGANGFIVQQTGSAANWIFNKAANSFISFLPIKDLLQSAIGAVANYFIDLMFDAPFVYHMSKTTDNEDPTQLDNVQTAISDLSTQLTESTDKLVNLDTAGTLRNDTSKLNEYILLTKNKFAALQRGVTIANYMV
ncbi:MAG: hypothetical protein LBT99_00295, partial [Bifidobacteriaceae bacterium]|nr:hypothetical protein [Bifidobacteriaceae bacterium]